MWSISFAFLSQWWSRDQDTHTHQKCQQGWISMRSPPYRNSLSKTKQDYRLRTLEVAWLLELFFALKLWNRVLGLAVKPNMKSGLGLTEVFEWSPKKPQPDHRFFENSAYFGPLLGFSFKFWAKVAQVLASKLTQIIAKKSVKILALGLSVKPRKQSYLGLFREFNQSTAYFTVFWAELGTI